MGFQERIIKKYFLILISFCAWLPQLYSQDVRFDEFVIEDGLTSVNALLIDNYGYKWFGGTHGLYKYNGYDFESYKHGPNAENSLNGNDIISLYEDVKHNIWIGMSNNGVNVFDRKKERILRLPAIPELSSSTVTTFIEDQNGNIWIGTIGNGIIVLNSDFSFKQHFKHNLLEVNSLSNNDVFDFLRDAEDQIWVVTNSGFLDLYESESGSFEKFQFYPKELSAIRSGQKILEVDPSKLWIGTEGQGIFEFDKEGRLFHPFNPHDNGYINTNIITGLVKDSKGNIWISTDGGGLKKYHLGSRKFTHYAYDEHDAFSISNNAFYSLLIDHNDRLWLGMGNGKVNVSIDHPIHFIREGEGISFNVIVDLLIDQEDKMWVATGGGGLDIYDITTHRFIKNINSLNQKQLKTNILLTLHEDKFSNIWIGTFLGGLSRASNSGNIHFNYLHKEGENSLSNDHIFDIVEDQDGEIWIATQGGGIDSYNPKEQFFKNYCIENRSGLISNRVQSLLADNQNRIWVGHFYGGLQLFDRNSEKFVSVELTNNLHVTLGQYPIHDIYQDEDNQILICTGGAGLLVLDSTFRHVKKYDEESGLPSNSVYGIIDFNNNYWVSTNAGLARINKSTGDIFVLDKSDGLISSDFESGAIGVSSEGILHFGSKEGIVYFDPELIQEYPEDPKIIFADLIVVNEAIKPGDVISGMVILEESLLSSKVIQLPYSHNSFSFSFACPEFEKTQKLIYRYQLRGWEERWVNRTADRRFVSYTNVDYGNYDLIVQVSTNGGKKWISGKTIAIHISPPYYFTKTAYLVYCLISFCMMYMIYRFVKGRITLRNQLKFAKFSREKDNELNQEKIEFFTGISHEIRTPLTLILGHLERLSNFKGVEQRLRNELNTISKNGNRLLMLINQLLDFRKMETGQLRLKVGPHKVVETIKEIHLPFRELAIQKNIELQFNHVHSESIAYIDASKIELILYNLLSNALKFTPANGRIEIKTEIVNEILHLTVTDSGEGIAEENLEKVFEPFFQGHAGSIRGVKGTGIGLALVKEVVHLHHGKIFIKSGESVGATFIVSIPIKASEYSDNELIELDEVRIEALPLLFKKSTNGLQQLDLKLLLVEDNLEILKFLEDEFRESYEVLTARDGKLGLEIATSIIPDIIISDVMMPEMDGIEMCRHLKNDIRTNHIPVILLTARTGFIHEHSGLDTGADDYITKPFQVDLLRVRTYNLIENRKHVHKKIRREFLLEPKKVEANDPNEQFILDIMLLIEKNISDEGYSVKKLALEMGMSHSVLYRKLLALTNLTVSAFIKSVRLKKAAQLLQDRTYSIGEIAFQTGFSNPKYFSTCFSAEFGQSPTNYRLETRINESPEIDPVE